MVREEARYLRRGACQGDYCRVAERDDLQRLPCGYLRDALKLLGVLEDLNAGLPRAKDSQQFTHKRARSQNAQELTGQFQVFEDQAFHYRMPKRPIFLDRLRR